MLPDFEIIQHQFLGGHDITIIPLADVHLGSAECMEQEFIKDATLTIGAYLEKAQKGLIAVSFKRVNLNQD